MEFSDDGPHSGSIEEQEKSLTFLRYFDTLFLIDDSSNMKRQWLDVSSLIKAITPICLKYDENGIDIYFVNHTPLLYFPGMSVRKSGYNNIGKLHSDSGKRDSAEAIFKDVKPGGKCKLGGRLKKILTWYMDRLKASPDMAPLNIIIITAGVTDDDLQSVLIQTAKDLDAINAPDHQLGVQLFQIGDDPEVRKKFEAADDELWKQAGTRDIVDTMAWSGWPSNVTSDDMVKGVLGAVSKRLDKRKSFLAKQPPPKKSVFEDD